jgi:hypothetical protein
VVSSVVGVALIALITVGVVVRRAAMTRIESLSLVFFNLFWPSTGGLDGWMRRRLDDVMTTNNEDTLSIIVFLKFGPGIVTEFGAYLGTGSLPSAGVRGWIRMR